MESLASRNRTAPGDPGRRLDVVDSQFHLGHHMDVTQSLAAMDAVGVRSALVDEFWGFVNDVPQPLDMLPGGVFRPTLGDAVRASAMHPDRFRHLLRVEYGDPDLRAVVRLARANPALVALRINVQKKADVKAFAEGTYDDLFATAVEHDLPVFMLNYDNSPLVERYLRAFPSLPIVVDHCGWLVDPGDYDQVLRLADYPNAYLKWCHARMIFGRGAWPYAHLAEPLRRAIDAFGAERILWASDISMVSTGESWAETLFYLRDSGSGLSAEEQEWILGRAARRMLKWPATDSADPHARERVATETEYRHGPAD